MRNAIWRIAKLVPVVVAFEDCLYGPTVVQGRSMQPTLCPDGVLRREVVLAEKWSIKLYRFHRGDVVLLRYSTLFSPSCAQCCKLHARACLRAVF